MDENYAIGGLGAPMKYTEEELDVMRAAFKGNERLVKLLRKVFMPDYDPYAPIGQTTHFNWLSSQYLERVPPQDRELMLLVQIRLNKIIEKGLMDLQVLSNTKKETPGEAAERRKKDSGK